MRVVISAPLVWDLTEPSRLPGSAWGLDGTPLASNRQAELGL